jgi:hypothetical protein
MIDLFGVGRVEVNRETDLREGETWRSSDRGETLVAAPSGMADVADHLPHIRTTKERGTAPGRPIAVDDAGETTSRDAFGKQ